MSDKKEMQLKESGKFLIEPNGPIRFVKVTDAGQQVWVPPEDAYMLEQDGCTCAEWESWTGSDGHTHRRCLSWHCHGK